MIRVNGNLGNLEKVLQRTLRRGRARECIFGASGSTNFDFFGVFMGLMYLQVCPKQPWIRHGSSSLNSTSNELL